MLRRLFILGFATMAILLAGLSQSATAQTCDQYNVCTAPQPTTSAPVPTPTPFGGAGAAFADTDGPSSDTVPTPAPTAEATTTDAEAPQLAFTGGESEVLAYVGSGLIAAGAIALTVRRRLDHD